MHCRLPVPTLLLCLCLLLTSCAQFAMPAPRQSQTVPASASATTSPIAYPIPSATIRTSLKSAEYEQPPLFEETPVPSRTPTMHPFATVAANTPSASLATPLARKNTPIPLSGKRISLANAGEVTLLSQWGKGRIKDVVYTPDGQYILLATPFGMVEYASTSLEQTNILLADMSVFRLVFSPDGSRLAAACTDGSVAVLTYPGYGMVRTLDVNQTLVPGDFFMMTDLAFSEQNSFLSISFHQVETIARWDLHSGERLQDADLHAGRLIGLIPAGDAYAVLNNNGELELYRFDVQQPFAVITQGWGENVQFSIDGKIFLSSDGEGVALFDVLSARSRFRVQDFEPYYYPQVAPDHCVGDWDPGEMLNVYQVVLSPDQHFFALILSKGGTQIRSAADGALVHKFPFSVARVIFSPQGKTYALLSGEQLEIYSLANHQKVGTLSGYAAPGDFAFSADTHQLYISSDGMLRKWDLASGQVAQEIAGDFSQLAVQPGTGRVFVGSPVGEVTIWNTDGDPAGTISLANPGAINRLAFDASGKILVVSNNDCTVEIWDSTSRRLSAAFPHADEDFGRVLSISPDGKLLPVTYYGTIVIQDQENKAKKTTLNIESQPYIVDTAFSPDQQIFLAASEEGILAWSVRDWQPLFSIPLPAAALAFSPSGDLLAVGGVDGTIYLFDTLRHVQIAALSGHHNVVFHLAFSADGSLLASGSADGTLMLWGIAR
jgi:WD40 repeat protein